MAEYVDINTAIIPMNEFEQRSYHSPADVQPVRRGKWIFWDHDPDANVYECSECHEPFTLNEGTPKENNMNYCPACGAKLEG